MPKFQGNRLKNTRGAIASSRIHAEFSLLNRVFSLMFQKKRHSKHLKN